MIIRAYYGIDQNPFSSLNISLLEHQQDAYDILQVHSQQGGFCLVMGDAGVGKSVIRETIQQNEDKSKIIVSVGRTLHTYTNTIKIICEAFKINQKGDSFKCENKLLKQVDALNQSGKSIITMIDDAHLLDMTSLNKLRLLFEEFPKNHNLILFGLPTLIGKMMLQEFAEIKSRITYSVILGKIRSDETKDLILDQLTKVGLGHNIFSDSSIDIISRASEGNLRHIRNLCLSCLLEAVRQQKKQINRDIVNKVLLQPHWRNDYDLDQI